MVLDFLLRGKGHIMEEEQPILAEKGRQYIKNVAQYKDMTKQEGSYMKYSEELLTSIV